MQKEQIILEDIFLLLLFLLFISDRIVFFTVQLWYQAKCLFDASMEKSPKIQIRSS